MENKAELLFSPMGNGPVVNTESLFKSEVVL